MNGSAFWPVVLAIQPLLAQAPCGNAQLQLASDYSVAIGSSNNNGAYTFTLGKQTLAQGTVPQQALFHYDNSLASTSGVAPTQSSGVSFVPGKFGSAVSFGANGVVSYPQAGNLSLGDGTVEMWVALQRAGTDPAYTQGYLTLFAYGVLCLHFVSDPFACQLKDGTPCSTPRIRASVA